MCDTPEVNPAPQAGKNGEKKPAVESTLAQDLYQTLRTLVSVLLVVILLFTFVVRLTVVDGESMEDSFHHGDILLTWALGYKPEQGDVVVLTKTSFRDQSIIKRVIATEGQTVYIDYALSRVYVDGVLLDEPYIKEAMRQHYLGENSISQVTVSEGCVFVMGDNRNNSTDSRDPVIGIVDARCIIGQAVLGLFPFSAFGPIE